MFFYKHIKHKQFHEHFYYQQANIITREVCKKAIFSQPPSTLNQVRIINFLVETVWQTLTSCRWILAYVSFVAFIFVYALRINMALAIVCMVKAVNTTSSESYGADECQVTDNSTALNSEVSDILLSDKISFLAELVNLSTCLKELRKLIFLMLYFMP